MNRRVRDQNIQEQVAEEEEELNADCFTLKGFQNAGTPNFRICARTLFVTYSRCNVSRQQMFNFFVSLDTQRNTATFICVAQEYHQDRTPHLHVLAIYPFAMDSSNCRFLDYDDGNEIFHPNIATCKRSYNVYRYITKTGLENCICRGTPPQESFIPFLIFLSSRSS
jgi:hypothetical protein